MPSENALDNAWTPKGIELIIYLWLFYYPLLTPNNVTFQVEGATWVRVGNKFKRIS